MMSEVEGLPTIEQNPSHTMNIRKASRPYAYEGDVLNALI